MKTMGERLRAARSAKYSSAAKAADALSVSASTYRAHENGQNEFNPEEAERYGRKFGVSAAYLLTGEQGIRPPSIVSTFDPDDDGNGYSRENWRPSMPGAIPEIDAKLGAGEGAVGELVNLHVGNDNYSGHRVVAEWILSETFLRHEAKASRQDTVIMEIIGDSMSPTYGPGDRVLVDQAQTRLVADTVYAISDGYGEPQIKRLQRIPFSEPVMVKIISDNPSLASFDVELERLTIIGRVCGHIARK